MVAQDGGTRREAERLAARLARLVEVPTVSDPEHRDEAPFEAFRARLAETFPRTHRLGPELIGDGALLFCWEGGPGPTTVLMAHYDVVPADAASWSRDPFGGEVVDGRLVGRGALDDKGPLLLVLEAVEGLLAEGHTPPGDVYLAFGDDEEVGGAGARAVVAELRRRGVRPDLVVDEGGAVVDGVVPHVRGPLAMIGVSEKGAATVELTTRAEAGHASLPGRGGAVATLADAIRRIDRHRFPARPNPVLAPMLAAMAERLPTPLAALATAGPAPRWVAPLLRALGGTAGAMVHTTAAFTRLSAGTAANVLAQEARATVNLRLAHGDTVEGVVGRLRRLVRASGVEVAVLAGHDPLPVSPGDGEAFARLRAALAGSHPEALAVPYVMVQSSDARHFAEISGHTYRFMPLAISAAQLAAVHGADESVDLAALPAGVAFYRHLLGRPQDAEACDEPG